ncbi:unnamed protein product [Hermetia illucens]|uniref:Farnesol dehydrogenase n=1 Tax=Hermetia illucens TaxID=343691 RepID=A0A7R8UFH9_HERIL|nr:farnesol dehydrogenase-like [Hermetia illucens]CAD7079072.1 unnamed protein product [Hermetia illucens]
MERWQNKVIVVTGASSGIGTAVVKDLLQAGLVVVGLARRYERMIALRNSLPVEQQPRFHPLRCDVSNEEDVRHVFEWVDNNLGGTDILVNNAGVAKGDICLITPDNTAPIRETIETNVMGVVHCTREAFKSMKKRNFDGHILIVNSVSGHSIWNFMNNGRFSFNMYAPSKFAITAMTATYRQEFAIAGTKVKITSISPGLVDTEIISDTLREKPMLQPEDISSAILFAISTPPHVQIHELTIKPVGEAW